MVEFFSVEARWQLGRQTVLTHVQQFTDRSAALQAGRRLAVRRRGVRVMRVIGDQTAGWMEPQVIRSFSPVNENLPVVASGAGGSDTPRDGG